MPDQPTWETRPNPHGRFRWQWTCRTSWREGLIDRTCDAWGLASTQAEADVKGRAHAATHAA